MRKVEKVMVEFIRDMLFRKEWTVTDTKRWHGGNTTVLAMAGSIEVYLHGHMIARYDESATRWYITLAGWNTATTRSRLSAILKSFTPAYGVGTKAGQARIVYPDKERLINDIEWSAV